MKVEIIPIGDEILIGQIVDTNSSWMAQQLTQQGFEIVAVTNIGDDARMLKQALDIAFERADILLLTGGVGPTKDDITKQTLCDYFHSELIFDASVIETIEQLFAKRNIPLNELTRNQAFVPDNSTVIQNPVGTAPILWFEKDGKVLVSMPGVPFEMKTAMSNEIIPRLVHQFVTHKYLKNVFLVSGISESGLAMRLQSFEEGLPDGFSLAYLPAYGMIRLRLSVRGESRQLELAEQSALLKSLLADNLVFEGDLSLEEIVYKILIEKNLSLSTAESCSGGYIAHRITTHPGVSRCFKGSVVAYANEIKMNLLNVSPETLEKWGAVSEETVVEMAKGCTALFQTDCAIAVSGIAGPDGGTIDKPVGTVWVCTAYRDKITTKLYHFGKMREENIARTSNMALLQLLQLLKSDI